MTQSFSLFLSKAMRSRINSCYSILFSNVKQKEHTLLLAALFAVTRVQCILKHPIYLFLSFDILHTILLVFFLQHFDGYLFIFKSSKMCFVLNRKNTKKNRKNTKKKSEVCKVSINVNLSKIDIGKPVSHQYRFPLCRT